MSDKPNAISAGNTLAFYLTKLPCLGAYLPGAKNPPPGNTVMWRGLTRLTDIQPRFVLGTQLVDNWKEDHTLTW